MKRFAFTFLVSLSLINLFLFSGCAKNKRDSGALTEEQNSQVSLQDNCNGLFNDNLKSVLTKVEENYFDSTFDGAAPKSTKNYADSEISLNPKWIKRLGDDATSFVDFNELLNKEKSSLFESIKSFSKNGVAINNCRISDNGKLSFSIYEPGNAQSNFSDLLKSYNELVSKRNDAYNKKLLSFQKDFEGTNFIVKPEQSFDKTKTKSIDKIAERDYLKNLYQSRIEYLLNISRG